MFDTIVYYNNFNLSSLPGVKIVNYNVTDLPTRILNSSKLARSNRSLLTSAEYSEKNVYIYGFVGGDDAWVTQDNFDRLKANLQEVEGIIRIKQGLREVEYTGTLNAINKEFAGPNIRITLEFKCSNPIGRDATTVELFPPITITTSTLNKSIVVEGSFVAEPRYTVRINSVTNGTNKTVSLLNAATGKGIKVTRNWQAGDIVSVTSDTMEVAANSIVIDFKGQFPNFLPGARTLQYIDDFDNRNVTLSAIYNRRYA